MWHILYGVEVAFVIETDSPPPHFYYGKFYLFSRQQARVYLSLS